MQKVTIKNIENHFQVICGLAWQIDTSSKNYVFVMQPIINVGFCGAQFCLIIFDDLIRIILHDFFNGRFTEAYWARLAYCGTTFCNQGFLVWCGCHVIYREKILQPSRLYSVFFPNNSDIPATPWMQANCRTT